MKFIYLPILEWIYSVPTIKLGSCFFRDQGVITRNSCVCVHHLPVKIAEVSGQYYTSAGCNTVYSACQRKWGRLTKLLGLFQGNCTIVITSLLLLKVTWSKHLSWSLAQYFAVLLFKASSKFHVLNWKTALSLWCTEYI